MEKTFPKIIISTGLILKKRNNYLMKGGTTMQQETNINDLAGNTLLLPANQTLRRSFYYFLKRSFDIIASLTALILLSPLMLLIAILIRLDSPGPALFIQQRVGGKRKVQSGKEIWKDAQFPCYKFRTMCQKADPSIHQAYIRTLINNGQSEQDNLYPKPTL